MGEAAEAAGGWARVQGTLGGGEAQTAEEVHRAWVDILTRLERVERAERDSERPGERAQGSWGPDSRPTLQPFRQPGIPPEVEREVQERTWKRIRGRAARLKKRDREVGEGGGGGSGPRGAAGHPTPETRDTPPRIRRDGCPLGKGQEGRERRVGMCGESDAKARSRERWRQRGRRIPPAPVQSQRRQTGVRNPRCRRIMRDILRGGCRGRSGGGRQGRWRSWSAT